MGTGGGGIPHPVRLSQVESRLVRGVRDKPTEVGAIVVDAFLGEWGRPILRCRLHPFP